MEDKQEMKEILKKAFEAGGKNALKLYSTDFINEECPDFDKWYEQEVENKDENRFMKCPNCGDQIAVFPVKSLYEKYKNNSIFKRK